MAGNETMIDAPVTPAPMFAYHALRGMFFGSPETPGVAMHIQQGQNAGTTDRISPTKALQMQTQVRLTPTQKRKRDSNVILSPTKSCLRTPGAMTPRKAKLKEITVTFKDTRMSISPELSRKGTEVQDLQANKENQNPTQEAIDAKVSPKPTATQPARASRNTTSEIPASKTDQELAWKPAVAAENAFNLEAYMAKTDGEMKKLIRYGRKMRDYARRQEDENTKLQRLVEALQQENERLKKGSTSPDEALKVVEILLPEKVDVDSIKRQGKPRLNDQITTTRETTISSKLIHPSTKHNQFALDELLNLDEARDTKDIHLSEPVPKQISTTSISRPRSIIISDQLPKQLSPSILEKSKPHATNSDVEPPDPHLSFPITTTGSTRLASDRLIAARARIQMKAELRKSSLEFTGAGRDPDPSPITNIATIAATATAMATAPAGTRTRKGMKTNGPEQASSRDNSVLDWAAL